MDAAGECKMIRRLDDLRDYNDMLDTRLTRACAFRNAARTLLDLSEVGSPNEYPGMYLYRHAVELFLKSILWNFGTLPEKHSHDLDDLRKRVLRIHDVQMSLTTAETITDLHNKDERSIKYRYCDEDQAVPPFDIETFREGIEKALQELEDLWYELHDRHSSVAYSTD